MRFPKPLPIAPNTGKQVRRSVTTHDVVFVDDENFVFPLTDICAPSDAKLFVSCTLHLETTDRYSASITYADDWRLITDGEFIYCVIHFDRGMYTDYMVIDPPQREYLTEVDRDLVFSAIKHILYN